MYAVINKFDINNEVTTEIETYLNNNKIQLLAEIPFHTDMVKAMIEGKTIVEYNTDSEISKAIYSIWKTISN